MAKPKKKQKPQGLALLRRLNAFQRSCVVLAIVLLVAAMTFLLVGKHNTVQSDNDTTKPAATATTKHETRQSKTDTATASSSKPSQSQTTPTIQPVQPFTITRVYFSQAPKAPPEAYYGHCTVGQVVNYAAVADVTATAAGTATVHWEVADYQGGTVSAFDDTAVTFASAGTKQVERAFTYTVRDIGNGTNYNNRQFINLFVTSPNSTYANKDNPVYAYRNSTEPYFVWGTYVDFC